jgi:TPR repeat protein
MSIFILNFLQENGIFPSTKFFTKLAFDELLETNIKHPNEWNALAIGYIYENGFFDEDGEEDLKLSRDFYFKSAALGNKIAEAGLARLDKRKSALDSLIVSLKNTKSSANEIPLSGTNNPKTFSEIVQSNFQSPFSLPPPAGSPGDHEI